MGHWRRTIDDFGLKHSEKNIDHPILKFEFQPQRGEIISTSFFSSPPAPLQLERGALLLGFVGVRQAACFVWFYR
jgi:hypothetical protein